MKIKSLFKNSFFSLLSQLILLLFGFLSQRAMNLYLGTELVGMNGVISNVIAMLSVTELGISTAIVYHLYSALVNKDEQGNRSFDESISQSVLYVCSHSSCARVNDYAFCSSIYEK